MSDINLVRARLSPEEQLAQLAEETMELAHAALKLRRVLGGSKNPTPVTMTEALDSFREEIADVRLCLRVLGYEANDPKCKDIMDQKLTRWVRRLREAEEVSK